MRSTSLASRWQSWHPYFLALLRIVAAYIFMLAGSMKIFAFPGGMPGTNRPADLFTQTWIGGVLEFFGGLLVAAGLFTRPVAFVLAGEMAVAYWQFHAPNGPWTTTNGGVAAALYCFVWLYFSSAGAGAWSVDGWRAKKAGA